MYGSLRQCVTDLNGGSESKVRVVHIDVLASSFALFVPCRAIRSPPCISRMGSTLSPTSGRCDPENPAYRQTGNETRYTIYRLPYKPLTGERALLFGKDWLSPANRACVSAGH